MLEAEKLMVLVILLADPHLGILAMIREDLGIGKPLGKPLLHEELCWNCLQPTGNGPSLELQQGCKGCRDYSGYKQWAVGHYLNLESEGEDRKIKSQLAYEAIRELKEHPLT